MSMMRFVLWLFWFMFCCAKNVRLPDLKFKRADTILTPISVFTNERFFPAYHSLFALTEDIAMGIGRIKNSENVGFELVDWTDLPWIMESRTGKVVTPQARNIRERRQRRRRCYGKQCSQQKQSPTSPTPTVTVEPLGEVGITLAWRVFAHTNLPYHRLTCNCRHYCDYFTYGRTFGSRKTIGYSPISSDCPLHDVITPATDTAAEEFYLRDKRGKRYKLEPDSRFQHIKDIRPFENPEAHSSRHPKEGN